MISKKPKLIESLSKMHYFTIWYLQNFSKIHIFNNCGTSAHCEYNVILKHIISSAFKYENYNLLYSIAKMSIKTFRCPTFQFNCPTILRYKIFGNNVKIYFKKMPNNNHCPQIYFYSTKAKLI